jgi:hypothetical protein
VYAYKAPEVPKPPVDDKKEEVSINTPKAVYDLEYPQMHPIIEPDLSQVFDKEACTKAIVAIKKNNTNFDVEIAKAFFKLAPKYNINPMRAISQSVLETGWFKFVGSSVKPEQHNYCGLGATGNGASGAAFDIIEDGVTAQLQHLFAYGCKGELPEGEVLIDPRFKYVTRGIAPNWEQLAGRWACPGYDGADPAVAVKNGATYGQKIDSIYERIAATTITSADITMYCKSVVEDKQPETTTPDTNVKTEEAVDKTKVSFIVSLLEKIIAALIKFFSKK